MDIFVNKPLAKPVSKPKMRRDLVSGSRSRVVAARPLRLASCEGYSQKALTAKERREKAKDAERTASGDLS